MLIIEKKGTIVDDCCYSFPSALLDIYQLIGTEETAVETSVGTLNLLHLNRDLRKGFEIMRIPHYYKEYKVAHTWGFWQEDIPHALSYLWGTKP